ncbi:putative recombinase RecA [Brevibacillus phage SecTim467]|uniref:Putative recombinase RecA n=2 Tax=Jenstvirus jenst TaxID=1982225 RepID=A0A0K2CPF7_9CAUD|nr:UvsX-like recombinase [Brevibacillus phage Jenst]ALA07227.1 putative recombinase RecA [Brevibacillus phage Jenst]ALA07444.1 putative recombinase RecA [Brevibacillus phage SecTim467]
MAKKTKVEELNEAVENISVEDLLSEIEGDFKKRYKDGSVAAFENYKQDEVDIWYPTGVATLDYALGGGFAGGRASEVFGEPSAGKSTIGYSTIAATQQAHPDRLNVIIDPENSSYHSKAHAEQMGVDFSKILYIGKPEGKPAYAEDMFQRIEDLFRNPKYRNRLGIVLLDSIGSLVSKASYEQDKKWESNARVGGISSAVTRYVEQCIDSGLVYESGAHIINLNQVRDNIGDQWNPYRTPGGNRLKHACAQRIEVAKSQTTKDFGNPNFEESNPLEPRFIGQRIKFKVVKNKVGGKQSATAAVDFYYGFGLDYYTNILNMAQYLGLLQGSGWMTLIDPVTGEQIAKYQGARQWRDALQKDEVLWAKIYHMVYAKMKGVDIDLSEWDASEHLSPEGSGEDEQ